MATTYGEAYARSKLQSRSINLQEQQAKANVQLARDRMDIQLEAMDYERAQNEKNRATIGRAQQQDIAKEEWQRGLAERKFSLDRDKFDQGKVEFGVADKRRIAGIEEKRALTKEKQRTLGVAKERAGTLRFNPSTGQYEEMVGSESIIEFTDTDTLGEKLPMMTREETQERRPISAAEAISIQEEAKQPGLLTAVKGESERGVGITMEKLAGLGSSLTQAYHSSPEFNPMDDPNFMDMVKQYNTIASSGGMKNKAIKAINPDDEITPITLEDGSKIDFASLMGKDAQSKYQKAVKEMDDVLPDVKNIRAKAEGILADNTKLMTNAFKTIESRLEDLIYDNQGFTELGRIYNKAKPGITKMAMMFGVKPNSIQEPVDKYVRAVAGLNQKYEGKIEANPKAAAELRILEQELMKVLRSKGTVKSPFNHNEFVRGIEQQGFYDNLDPRAISMAMKQISSLGGKPLDENKLNTIMDTISPEEKKVFSNVLNSFALNNIDNPSLAQNYRRSAQAIKSNIDSNGQRSYVTPMELRESIMVDETKDFKESLKNFADLNINGDKSASMDDIYRMITDIVDPFNPVNAPPENLVAARDFYIKNRTVKNRVIELIDGYNFHGPKAIDTPQEREAKGIAQQELIKRFNKAIEKSNAKLGKPVADFIRLEIGEGNLGKGKRRIKVLKELMPGFEFSYAIKNGLRPKEKPIQTLELSPEGELIKDPRLRTKGEGVKEFYRSIGSGLKSLITPRRVEDAQRGLRNQ